MQIVIEIPDNKYQWIKDNPLTYDNEYCEAIRKGTPLSKGHGRLKDADEIARHFQNLRDSMNYYGDAYEARGWQCYDIAVDAVMDAPTIIEADKEE